MENTKLTEEVSHPMQIAESAFAPGVAARQYTTCITYQDAKYQVIAEYSHKSRADVKVRAILLETVAVNVDEITTQSIVSSRSGKQVDDLISEKHGAIGSTGLPYAGYGTNDLTVDFDAAPSSRLPTPPRFAGVGEEPVVLGMPQAPLLIGFDSEWYTPRGAVERIILSIQFSFRCVDGRELQYVIFTPEKMRLHLPVVLGWLLIDTAEYTGFRLRSRQADANTRKIEPKFHITLAGFYTIVDISVFLGASKLLRGVDSLRRSVASVVAPLVISVWSADRNRTAAVVVNVRDALLLAPEGSSVEKLGDALRCPKLTLPINFSKDRMHLLLASAPDIFIAYAIRDAEITRRWIEQMINAFNARVPITLGGLAARAMRTAIMKARGWKKEEFEFQWRGVTRQFSLKYGENAKPQRTYVDESRPTAAMVHTAASHSFYGGRNECFLHGIQYPASNGAWFDYDLTGAYPTAMCLVADPDYSKPAEQISGRIERGQIRHDCWGFGYIRFKFPISVHYPCLPVKDQMGRGLVFPRAGETWACAPEVWLALELGAEVEVLHSGIIQPTTSFFSLADGVLHLVQARVRAREIFGAKSPQELAAKTMANAGYGKTAQGVAGKRSYSTRANDVLDTAGSVVTSAPHAALTTSYVRAIVSAAMNQLHELGARIASVTTDGFLADASFDVLDSLDLFGLGAVIAAKRKWLTGETQIWEIKHAAQILLMMKTRGGVGIGMIDGMELPAAGAGFKLSGDRVESAKKHGKSETLGELFLQRTGSTDYTFYQLPSPKDYVRNNADGIGKKVKRKVSWEYDYKRAPNEATVREESVTIKGVIYHHVSYDTQPWNTINDFVNAREVTKGLKGAVKTSEDFHEQQLQISRRPNAMGKGIRARGGVNRSAAVSVLRALRSGAAGAAWYTEATKGIDVCKRIGAAFDVRLTENDWKHAGRIERSCRISLVGLTAKLAELEIVIKTKPPIDLNG